MILRRLKHKRRSFGCSKFQASTVQVGAFELSLRAHFSSAQLGAVAEFFCTKVQRNGEKEKKSCIICKQSREEGVRYWDIWYALQVAALSLIRKIINKATKVSVNTQPGRYSRFCHV